jgi:hypothetical protein
MFIIYSILTDVINIEVHFVGYLYIMKLKEMFRRASCASILLCFYPRAVQMTTLRALR